MASGAVTSIGINDLIIRKEGNIYGCKYSDKYIVGVGCILYDKKRGVVMLGNEYNKQQRILQLNPSLSSTHGYFEDFGGKIEYKHEDMHILDVALGELFEETAMLFNLHFEDLKKCIEQENFVLIDVPNTMNTQYMCIIIPFSLKEFSTIHDKFHENIKAINNTTITCQKQFYEINDVRFFQIEKLNKLTTPSQINGFYGLPDTVFMCEELCGQYFYISSRIVSVTKHVHVPKIYSNTLANVTGNLYNLNGIQHLVSIEYGKEAKTNLKNELMYLQKYFVSRLDSTTPGGAKIAIGGDIPLMYFNEIQGYVYMLDSPRLIIYTDNPCFVLFNNVNMKYNGDKTNIYLSKWIKPKPHEPAYSCGTFFQLNDRIYFSYLNNKEYNRIFIGLVRLLDDSIITYDNIVYKQTLAVEICSSTHIQCMEELVKTKQTKTATISYFDDNEIASIRQWNPAALNRFYKYRNNKELNITIQDKDKDKVHLKGKYAIFNHVTDLCCTNEIRFNGTNIESNKTLSPHVTELFNAIKANLTSSGQLCRASMPFEFDCDANANKSVFDFETKDDGNNDKFVYNSIMWASEAPKLEKIPNFYLGAGLYDCFIITPPGNNKIIVPYYRFKDTSFDYYRVAYECIIPPGVEYEVENVEFGVISVCSLVDDNGSLVDGAKETYWRRIITIKPILSDPLSSSPQPTKQGGEKTKAKVQRKPRNSRKKLNEESITFY